MSAVASPPALDGRGSRVEFSTRRGALAALDDVGFAMAPGEIPPPGCPFHPRGIRAMDDRRSGEVPRRREGATGVRCHHSLERLPA